MKWKWPVHVVRSSLIRQKTICCEMNLQEKIKCTAVEQACAVWMQNGPKINTDTSSAANECWKLLTKTPHALVAAWCVGYLRKLSVIRNPWDKAVALPTQASAVFVGWHGRNCRGLAMSPSKLCPVGAILISAAEVLMLEQISARAFLFLHTKTER